MSTAITVPLTVHGEKEFDERVEMSCGGSLHARSIERIHRRIVTSEHCFGCTAGHESSCAGALT